MYEGTVSVPAGGWVAARVVGPPSKHIADSYAFAQTTPVYVVRNGKTFVSQDDARFLAGVVDAIWARTMRSPWRSDAERDGVQGADRSGEGGVPEARRRECRASRTLTIPTC